MPTSPLRALAGAFALVLATPVAAQLPLATTQAEAPAQALARDAAEYARLHAVDPDEAMRRLHVQEASVPITDALAAEFAARLAGISIEHRPGYRVVVLLTGTEPVPDRLVPVADTVVPVTFRTGARATRTELVSALQRHQAEIRAALIRPPGMGVDQRSGELVVIVGTADADAFAPGELQAQLAARTGVPVRVATVEQPGANLSIDGGARIAGTSPVDGRRYICTTGFTVTDGVRDGVVTAAHCPDTLSYMDPDPDATPLSFVGQWGWGYQDVQVNAAAVARLNAAFFADTAKTRLRPVTGQRSRASTRAGDLVCHRGERTGYSCAEVVLTDFAPAGDLCGGACLPTWVAVNGPTCRAGDSGGPVFIGTTALGLVKGASYRADGGCSFYFYMSTDYLPAGWSLLTQPQAVEVAQGQPSLP